MHLLYLNHGSSWTRWWGLRTPFAWIGQRWSEPLHSQDHLHRQMWCQLDTDGPLISFLACNGRWVISVKSFNNQLSPNYKASILQPPFSNRAGNGAKWNLCKVKMKPMLASGLFDMWGYPGSKQDTWKTRLNIAALSYGTLFATMKKKLDARVSIIWKNAYSPETTLRNSNLTYFLLLLLALYILILFFLRSYEYIQIPVIFTGT